VQLGIGAFRQVSSVVGRARIFSAIPARSRGLLIQAAVAILLLCVGVVIGKTLAWIGIAVALTALGLLALATFNSPAPEAVPTQRGTQTSFPPAPSASTGQEERSVETRRLAAESIRTQTEHQRSQEANDGKSAPPLPRDARRAAADKALEASAREQEQRERIKRELRQERLDEERETDPMAIKHHQQQAARLRPWSAPPASPPRPGDALTAATRDQRARAEQRKRTIERGDDLRKRIHAAHIQYRITGGTIAGAIVLDKLTAEAEGWALEAGSPDDAPKANGVTTTGADFARLQVYVEGKLRGFESA
jgi:hypothetical protein